MPKIEDTSQKEASQRLVAAGGIYSQAQNFLGVVSTAVDSRTGQFMLAINLPTLIANHLCGPTLTFNLSYSAMASLQNSGYGLGWSLALSELVLNATSSRLRLSSGEQFSIDRERSEQTADARLVFLDHKLNDILVTRLSESSYRVERKTGEIEILTRQTANSTTYLLSEMRTPEGRRLYVHWRVAGNEVFMVDRVEDEMHRVLLRTRSYAGGLDFMIEGEEDALVIKLSFANNRLSQVSLSSVPGQFTFNYVQRSVGNGLSLWFPETLSGPLGASDSINWTSQAMSHRLPSGAPFTHLPRVSAWRHSPGTGISLTHVYTWVGNTNFFGFGSALGFRWEDGRDNLYKVEHAYQYTNIETLMDGDQVLATTRSTWNNFHLLVESVTAQGTCEVKTRTSYGIDENAGWENQPPYCQLPHSVTTTYRDIEKDCERSEKTEYNYDDSGNILSVIYPTGAQETNIYYPFDSHSQEGCPVDVLGLKLEMIRFLKKKSTIPAPSDVVAPTLSTSYTYKNLDSLAPEDKDTPHAVVVKETAWDDTSEVMLETTDQTYDEDKDSPHYGREKTAITTLNGKATVTRFAYSLHDNQLTTEVCVEGHDFVDNPTSTSSTSDCRSSLTGQTLNYTTAAGARTAYEYDSLGRIVKTIVAEGTAYQATRSCVFHMNDPVFLNGNRPSGIVATVAIEETDASGQCRRTWLDGDGRNVCVELEDIDVSPAMFREISRTSYDALGRVIAQTHQEWSGNTPLFSLKTTTGYDDWGNVSRLAGPTGVVTCTRHDPVALRTEQWLESAAGTLSGKQVTISNVAGSSLEQQVHDQQGRLIRTTRLKRDGLDRVVERRLKVDGKPDVVFCYSYDALSRVVTQIRPDGSSVHQTYAAHSDGMHFERVELTPGKVL